MTGYKKLLAANTSGYGGYDLRTALEHIAALGYPCVEIAAMAGLVEHVRQVQMTSREVRNVRSLLDDFGLHTNAFSAHLFLNRPGAAEMFLPRMDFAREIGASIINTKAGKADGLDTFLKNMGRLIRHAEEIGIVIGLETHGDIVDHGADAVEAIRGFDSKHVVLNYDFGNVYQNSIQSVDPADDFETAFPVVGHLHLKDLVLDGETWRMCPIGAGSIDYDRIFSFLGTLSGAIPLTVDLPLNLIISTNYPVRVMHRPLEIEEIDRVLRESLNFISEKLLSRDE